MSQRKNILWATFIHSKASCKHKAAFGVYKDDFMNICVNQMHKNLICRSKEKNILRFVFIYKHIIEFDAYKKWFHGSFHHSEYMKIRFAGQKKNILRVIFIDRKTTWKYINTEFGVPKKWFYQCLYQSKHILIKIEHVRVEKVR